MLRALSQHIQHFGSLTLVLSEFLANFCSRRKTCLLDGSPSGSSRPRPTGEVALRCPPRSGCPHPLARPRPPPAAALLAGTAGARLGGWGAGTWGGTDLPPSAPRPSLSAGTPHTHSGAQSPQPPLGDRRPGRLWGAPVGPHVGLELLPPVHSALAPTPLGTRHPRGAGAYR